MASKQPVFAPARFLVIAIACVVLSFTIIINIISVKPALSQFLDFGSFIAAGKEAATGKNPYTIDSPLVYRVESENTDQTLPSPNLNPPLSVVLFAALSDMEPINAVSGWRVVTAFMFGMGIFILAKSYPKPRNPTRILWALSLAGFWNTIALGQIYAPILILAIGAWILAERGSHKLAGLALGAMIAIKPNFAFWLALLGIAGYTTIAVGAIVTALILSALPILILGLQIYPQWLTALSNYPSIGLLIAGNSSLQSLSARLGLAHPGTAISLLFIAGSLCFAYRNKKSLSKINTLGIVGSLLVSPFSWAGYTMLTLPIFFSRSNWSWQYRLSAAIFSFPYVLILYFFHKSPFNFVLFGWIYGWGLLLILTGMSGVEADELSGTFMGNQS